MSGKYGDVMHVDVRQKEIDQISICVLRQKFKNVLGA